MHSVTSVGGTANIPEEAAKLSVGGFSNLFSTPAYQSYAASAYINSLGSINSGLYNATGRGFPDVSAYAEFYTVIQGGIEMQVNGTSASAPVFAAIISLLNDQLLSAGKPPLGFLNPLLYSNGASAFNDITSGDNYACSNYTTGFEASVGWDPVRSCLCLINNALTQTLDIGYWAGYARFQSPEGSRWLVNRK